MTDTKGRKMCLTGRTLIYKGVEFDYWGCDEYGFWSNICREHAEQYADVFGSYADGDFYEWETCGIKGCYTDGREPEDEGTAYIDFDEKYVVIKTVAGE